LRGLWSDASRSELALLRYAINHDWPVPYERRRPILEEIFELARFADARKAISAFRVFIAADWANLRAEEHALRRGM
jgi:hypothetical protein